MKMKIASLKRKILKPAVLIILVVFGTLLIMISAEIIFSPPREALPLGGNWTITYSDGRILTEALPFYYMAENDEYHHPGIVVLSKTVNHSYPEKDLRIVFPYLPGNGVRLKVNGLIIGSMGDLSLGNSIRWNVPFQAIIPGESVKPELKLEMEVYNLYEYGLLKLPYILPAESHPLKLILLFIFGAYFTQILIGSFITLAVFILIEGILIKQWNRSLIFMGLSLVFASLFLLEFCYLDYIPISYLGLKRLTISSVHFTISTVMFSTFWSFTTDSDGRTPFRRISRGMRLLIIIVIIEFILGLIIVFTPGDILALRRFYQWANLSVFPSTILVLILIATSSKRRAHNKILLVGILFAILLSIRDVLSPLFNMTYVFLTHFGLSLFLVSAVTELIIRTLSNYRNWQIELIRADNYRIEALSDPLTGIGNRKVLTRIESELPAAYSILALDLDRFKILNDTYGHPFGDKVLICLVDLLRCHTREEDSIIRMGGDEFIVLLPGCSNKTAKNLTKRINFAIEETIVSLEGNTSTFSCSIGSATRQKGEILEDVLHRADEELYKAKEVKKTAPSGTAVKYNKIMN